MAGSEPARRHPSPNLALMLGTTSPGFFGMLKFRVSREGLYGLLQPLALAFTPLVTALAGPVALAGEPGLSLEVSREFLRLPQTNFTFTFDNSVNLAPNAVPSKEVNHDGNVAGARVDLSYGTRTMLFGTPLIATVKGYYSEHEGTQATACSPTATLGCGHTALVDPNFATQQLVYVVAPAQTSQTTHLFARTWGTALEGQSLPQHWGFGTVAWKGGIGYRNLATSLALAGTNTFERPVTLAETITTDYWGGFVGAFFKAPLAPGLTATLDTEAGLYWAHTEYSGNYSQTSIVSIPSANVTQSLLLARDAPAVIASLKLGLEQDLGGIRAGVFVRGEYYSYVPSMAYNDVDRLTGLCGGRGCGGGNDGTSIGNGQMLSASFGARVTVPFGQ